MYSGDIIFVLHVNYFKDMKKYLKYCLLVWIAVPVWAQQTEVIGPDSHLKVNVALKQGKPVYSVTYKEKTILEDSPLGVVTDIGDFSRNMNWIGQKTIKHILRTRSRNQRYTIRRMS